MSPAHSLFNAQSNLGRPELFSPLQMSHSVGNQVTADPEIQIQFCLAPNSAFIISSSHLPNTYHIPWKLVLKVKEGKITTALEKAKS